MSDSNARLRAEQLQPLATAIIEQWHHELNKLELVKELHLPSWDEAEFELQRDPASGEDSLKGSWRGQRNELLGSVICHPDGSFYGEYDVIRTHPRRDGWFIEAVVAWGRDGAIKSELRMLPMVE